MTMATAGTPRGSDEQAQLETILFEWFTHRIPFNQVIGLTIESMTAQDVRTRFEMRPELVGHVLTGRLHGGVISSVLDATGGLATMLAIAQGHASETVQHVLQRISRLGTIDLRVDFLRQGLGKHFVASAETTRLGGRVASTQMRLVNDEGTLIATGAAAYIVS